MFFDLDRLNFMAPFTNNVRPTKCDSKKNTSTFQVAEVVIWVDSRSKPRVFKPMNSVSMGHVPYNFPKRFPVVLA